MRFTATAVTALLFGANAMAQDLNSEDVSIADFIVHKAGASGGSAGIVDGVSFKLTGNDATDLSCSATADQITDGVPTDVITCGDSKYRFALVGSPDYSTFILQVFHELGTASGLSGQGTIGTYCRSGGLDNVVCTQAQSPTTIHLDSLPQ
ncbi:hypothetical protein F5Y00DRAFT_248286 [Daldinia vernicosa]|uniref:uncharacterized protein n=1 Tax=Daldinia vernicosa TaxID=114800 RepID=UPI0020085626|nr:uncharacterized protein F5Y00DRAFT_248286 [Daldinia vernicosa]KAI0844658.1 hypothetical protein F5Y00DRAFT_248286 [Daldinia vernicosa]